jgi:hypothetical protein
MTIKAWLRYYDSIGSLHDANLIADCPHLLTRQLKRH